MEASGDEGTIRIVHCVLFFSSPLANIQFFEVIYGTAASPRQRRPAAGYSVLATASPATMQDNSSLFQLGFYCCHFYFL